MSLLQELLAEGCPAANPANYANHSPLKAKDSHDSHDSQGPTVSLRNELLELAAHSDAADVVRALPEAELQATHEQTAGMPDTQRADVLGVYLRCLDDTRTRNTGHVPTSETAAIMCRHCGPVWASPDVADMLSQANGWPRALGCPWCHVTPPTGRNMPRPRVTPCECTHWQPATDTPAGGFGQCACGSSYPHAQRVCGRFIPQEVTP